MPSFKPLEHLRLKDDCLPTFGNALKVFMEIKKTILTLIKERFQAVKKINNLFNFWWVFNEDDVKSRQRLRINFGYSNQLSVEIVDEKLFLTYAYLSNLCAANFKVSSTPKNILAEPLEMSLIDIFQNVSVALRIFLLSRVSHYKTKRTFSLQKGVKNYQSSTMTQNRLNGL